MSDESADMIKRVEGLTGPDDPLDFAIRQAFDPNSIYPCPQYTASVDAVISLIGEKMPGWEWLVRANPSGRRYDPVPGDPDHFFEERDAGLFMGNVHVRTALFEQPEETFPGYAPTPALALLLAFLRAWSAKSDG